MLGSSLQLLSLQNNPVITQQKPRRITPAYNVNNEPDATWQPMFATSNIRWGELFQTLFGKTFVAFRFYIKRLGSPTGNVTAGIQDASGADVKTVTVDAAANVPTGGAIYTISGLNFTIASGSFARFWVRYAGGDVSNNIQAKSCAGQWFGGTIARLTWSTNDTAWSNSSTEDLAAVFWITP